MPNDLEIEAAAIAISQDQRFSTAWHQIADAYKEIFRRDARAALTAAEKVRPAVKDTDHIVDANKMVVPRKLMAEAHSVMREAGWHNAVVYQKSEDGIIEAAATEIEQAFGGLLAAPAAPVQSDGWRASRSTLPFEVYESVRQAAENAVLAGERMPSNQDTPRSAMRQRAKDACVSEVWKAFDAALATLPAAPAAPDGWLPIESAPKHTEWRPETPFDFNSGVAVAFDDEHEIGKPLFLVYYEKVPGGCETTHWMPLPTSPAPKE